MTASIPQESRLPLRLARLGAITLAAATLSACALSPGMHMGSPSAVQSKMDQAGDEAPAGALINITPQLLREQQAAVSATISDDVKALFGTPQPYTIGPGDILNIVVWDHPELAMMPITSSRSTGSPSQADIGNGYNVDASGLVQFPYVGALKVTGKTELEVRNILMKKLASYIKDPQVTVRVQSYRNRRVYVDGEVRQPGLQVMDDLPMTLPEALSRAGGFTQEADRSTIVLTRKNKSVRISMPDLLRLGINPNKIMLTNGDMVRVRSAEDNKIFVMGEVLNAISQPMRDGKWTLADALGAAGGPNPLTSQVNQIYVVRKGKQDDAEIYHLNASSPTAFVLANGFELQPDDLVYVDPAAVVRWQRVIGNILPSYAAVTATRSATR
ncbi:polysaccharide biosynthesis/export family protein [Pusillimonas sp. ANT_WB101]|uniref:polysaccharide biosynthesis/export family protein n=1 Tax=Pusillimonas sp. ANT_WB101 TaxID=2597356 RepID=UPI0011ED2778|nr:polysaccharide biosynthesis/export family protein [Pusillimonas sp. ANT_WB101]KAA0911324.1 sugar transporter [Pusillimonas sp. ANT_WB101]